MRGRSPRNFQARKEIPLLGSSAGSRGQALVETGLGIVAGPLTIKPGDAKARALNLEVPRGAFTFNTAKLSGSPSRCGRSKFVFFYFFFSVFIIVPSITPHSCSFISPPGYLILFPAISACFFAKRTSSHEEGESKHTDGWEL